MRRKMELAADADAILTLLMLKARKARAYLSGLTLRVAGPALRNEELSASQARAYDSL